MEELNNLTEEELRELDLLEKVTESNANPIPTPPAQSPPSMEEVQSQAIQKLQEEVPAEPDPVDKRAQLLEQAKVLRPKTGPIEVPQPSAKPQDLLAQFKALQDKQKQQISTANMMQSMSGLSDAISGYYGANPTDKSNYEQMRKQASLPTDQFLDRFKAQDTIGKLEDNQNERDPNSKISRVARLMAKKQGIENVPEDATFFDLKPFLAKSSSSGSKGNQQGYGTVDIRDNVPLMFDGHSYYRVKSDGSKQFVPSEFTRKMYSPQLTTDVRTGEGRIFDKTRGYLSGPITGPTAGLPATSAGSPINPTTGAFAGPTDLQPKEGQEEQIELDIHQLPPKGPGSMTQVEDYRKQFLSESSANREAITAAKNIKTFIQAGRELNGDILRNLQNQFARASGERGVMTEHDVAPFGGRQDVLSRLDRYITMAATGRLREEDKVFLDGLADTLEQASRAHTLDKAKFFTENLYRDVSTLPHYKGKNLNKESISKLLGADMFKEEKKQGEVSAESLANEFGQTKEFIKDWLERQKLTPEEGLQILKNRKQKRVE